MKKLMIAAAGAVGLLAGAGTTSAFAVALFAFPAQAATYTWNTEKSSGNWDDAANWTSSDGGATYPSTSSDIAKFSAGTTASVALTTAHTIKQLDLSAANIKLTLKLADGATRDNAKLTISSSGTTMSSPTLNLSGANLDITLDGVSMDASGIKPQMGIASKLSIINGAAFSSSVFYNQAYGTTMAGNDEGGKIYIAGESTVDMAGLHLQNGLLEIDNSTLTSEFGLRFWNDTSATIVRLKGKSPLFKTTQSGGEGEAYANADGYNVHFEFVIPEGGYTAAPIQSGASAQTFPSSRTGRGIEYSGTYAFDVSADSPAKVAGESFTATLVSWAKGFNTSKLTSVNLPQTTDSYDWTSTTLDVTLKGQIVSAVEKIENGEWKGVDLSFGASKNTRELFVAYGATDGGTDTTKWTTVSLGSLENAATKYHYLFSQTTTATWGSESFKFIRFYIVSGDVVSWSETIAWYNLAMLEFAAAPTAVDAGGDAITVSGEMKNYPGDTCVLKVLTGKSGEALADEWTDSSWVLSSSDGGKAFSFTLCETDAQTARLAPGNTYDVAVVATSAGMVTTSGVTTVATVATANATPKFSNKGASVDRRTVTFSVELSALGFNGKADVTLWIGEMADGSDFKQIGETNTVTKTGVPFLWNPITFDVFGKTYYYQLRMTNSSTGGTVTMSVDSMIGTFTTTDDVTYEWTGNAGDSAWTNANNWKPATHGDDCLGYPGPTTSTAKFPAGTTVEFVLAENVSIGTLDLSEGGASVSFKKDASATSAPLLTIASTLDLSGKDNVFALDGMRLWVSSGNHVTLGSNSTWKVENAGTRVAQSPIYPYDVIFYNKGGKLCVENGAEFVCQSYYMSDAAYLLVKDATFTVNNRTVWNSADAANPDVIRLEGSNTVYKMAYPESHYFCAGTENAVLNLDFVVPKTGFAAAPLRSDKNDATYALGEGNSKVMKSGGVLNVNLIQEEYAKLVTTPLISWPGAGISKSVVKEGRKPRNAAKFLWKDSAGAVTTADCPVTLDAEIPDVRGFILIVR